MVVRSSDGTVFTGNEVSFLSPDEATYPQLTRLYLDFDFRVLAVPTGPEEREYLVSYKDYDSSDALAITPLFASLAELERYTDDNIIEILRTTVFEFSEDD